jgi:uncharacterized membrane protein YbhN (UPF0104 family)
MASSRARGWMRFGVSLALLIALLYVIPVRQLAAAVARVPPHVLLLALVVLLIGHVAAALKWRLLQRGATGLSVSAALRAHFYGVLANLWLPGVVGGDFVRAGMIYRETTRPNVVVLASLVDRIIDSAALFVLAAGGALLLGSPTRSAWHVLLAAFAAAVTFAVGAVVVYRLAKPLRAKHARMRSLVEAVDLMAERPAVVAAAFAVSVGIQTAFIVVNIQLGRAVGMTAPLNAWFMAWPLAKLAALVPISAAGLGVREAALIALMRPFGDPAQSIMAAGLLWQAVFIAGGILGVTIFVLPERARLYDARVASIVRSER